MATRKTRRPATRKAAPKRRRRPAARAAAPTRRRRRKVSSKFTSVLGEILQLTAGNLAGKMASDFATDKLGDKLTGLPMGDKVDYAGLGVGLLAAQLAKTQKKNKFLFMGLSAGGFSAAIDGVLPKKDTTTTGRPYTDIQDVEAILLSNTGVNSLTRVSGENSAIYGGQGFERTL